MANILKAETAYNETRYRKEADEILEKAAESIMLACNKGFFSTTINIDVTVEPDATDLAVKDLRAQGYTVKCILDTYPDECWSKLIIDWNLKKED